jgi:serine protease Do
LVERNVVDIRGFPLGFFKATTQGKVISAFDRDSWQDWDHDDFVVDAALSSGNSGSPVLAVSCQSGEFELVGVFHADYSRGNSLNVVVHIDALKELMATLTPRNPKGREPALDELARRRLVSGLATVGTLYFPFGAAPAAARLEADGSISFEVFPRDFPYQSWSALGVQDLPPATEGFGAPGRVRLGSARGTSERLFGDLSRERQGLIRGALDALRRSALLALTLRQSRATDAPSREAAELAARTDRALRRSAAKQRELSGQVLELAQASAPERPPLAPTPGSASPPDGGR